MPSVIWWLGFWDRQASKAAWSTQSWGVALGAWVNGWGSRYMGVEWGGEAPQPLQRLMTVPILSRYSKKVLDEARCFIDLPRVISLR